MELNLTSNLNGATVLVAGRERGITPLHLLISAGHHSIEFRKTGFTSYITEVEITASATPKVSAPKSATPTPVITTTLATGQAITNTQTTKTLPAYALNAELWPDRSILQPLPQPLPNARIEYARFLNSKTLELTYLTAEGGTLPPGSEGLPTNLWLYHPGSNTQPGPVILTQATIESIARYYGIISGDKPVSSTFTEALSHLAFANPVISPEGNRLAIISNALAQNSSSQSRSPEKNANNQTPAWWDDQAIWLNQLDEKLSAGGAVLTGLGNSQPLKLFSLANLVQLLPGINLPSTTGSYSSNQRFATLKEISWSPNGSQLLVAVELSQASLTGNRTISAGSSGTVTILVLVGTGGGSAPGQATIVTPQPLTEQILPGTLNWSADGMAVSFVVGQGQGSIGGNQSQFSLCVLDLRYANRLSNAAGAVQTSPNTPLRYLSQLNSAGVWNTRNSYQSFNLSAGKIYPPVYGSVRYNPFTWPIPFPEGTDNPDLQQLSKFGLYSAAGTGQGQATTSSSRQFNINNIYAYFRDDQSTRLLPNLSDFTTNNKITPTAKSAQSQGKTGNYPFWLGGENPLYFATRLLTSDKDKSNQGGLLGGGSSGQTWQLAVDTLVLPPEMSGREDKPMVVAPGVNLRFLTERHTSIILSLAANLPSIPGLAPGRFEVQWRPDGLGALITLASPSGQNNNNNQIWLASWDKN